MQMRNALQNRLFSGKAKPVLPCVLGCANMPYLYVCLHKSGSWLSHSERAEVLGVWGLGGALLTIAFCTLWLFFFKKCAYITFLIRLLKRRLEERALLSMSDGSLGCRTCSS